ncbi:YraN family protein [soil metagenome]
MHQRQILGRQGEALAATHLADAGYVILHRNWRATGVGVPGELDIVARRGRTLAVCEVKTRRSRWAGSPAEAVGWDKRRRLRRLTDLYLQTHPHPGPVRGDVITVDVAAEVADDTTVLTHLRGVW